MMQNKEKRSMQVLGLTGGIGSGKTLVLHLLGTEYDAYIVEADRLAHELMEPGQAVYRGIIDAFGAEVLAPDKTIDRKALGGIVFHDKQKLDLLNQISHPIVKASILTQIDEQNAAGRSLFVIEAALLIQDGYKEICDAMCYVYADQEIRIKRLMEHRHYTKERAIAVIRSQPSDDYYQTACDITLDNSGTPEETRKNLHDVMRIFAAKK